MRNITARASQTVALYVLLLSAPLSVAQSYTMTVISLFGQEGTGVGINAQGNVAGQLFANGKEHGFFWSPSRGISVLPTLPGGSSSYATGIDGQNVVAGYATFDATGRNHATIWTNGTIQDLGTLAGGTTSWANSINIAGEIAGASDSTSFGPHAIVWSAAQGMQDLGVLPGGISSWGASVNRFGQVVGYSIAADGTYTAFVWSKTTGMQDLGTLPKGGGSSGNAINDLGQIVGYSDCGSNCVHAVLWSKNLASLQDLGTLPGSTGSIALGLNNSGQVVGGTYSLQHAFLWTQTAGMQDLNALIPPNSGWTLVSASAINDKGEILGMGESSFGLGLQAILLTPVNK